MSFSLRAFLRIVPLILSSLRRVPFFRGRRVGGSWRGCFRAFSSSRLGSGEVAVRPTWFLYSSFCPRVLLRSNLCLLSLGGMLLRLLPRS